MVPEEYTIRNGSPKATLSKTRFVLPAARFPDEIQDSVCVGQRRPEDEDERVLLFLLMKPGAKFTEELVTKVKTAISQDVGRRCVPKYVFETPEIPVSQSPIP